MRIRSLFPVAVALALAVPGPVAATGQAPDLGRAPAAITRSDFLRRSQIRDRLDLSRPLSEYLLSPTDTSPGPDPDCATAGRPEATAALVYPALRTRTQSFSYSVAGPWHLEGRALVLEYASRAKARAAYRRAVASVRLTTHYTLVCEAIDPIVSGQVPTRQVQVPGSQFTWRYHLRASHAGSWRDVIATRGRRVVWVELGRVYDADLDWSSGTPAASFPRYPSLRYLGALARGAVAKGL